MQVNPLVLKLPIFMFDLINCWLHQIALQVAIDSATPVDDAAGPSGNQVRDNLEPYGGYGGPMRTYGQMYGSLDFDNVSIIKCIVLSLSS